jgi:hypothetical protein
LAQWPCTTFPPPPLKFRTAGFPQYGLKSTFLRDLHGRRTPATYTRTTVRRPAATGIPLQGNRRANAAWVSESRRTLSIQRPLARQRVVVSRRVSAYYGLIRASGTHPPGLFASSGGRLGRQRVPTLFCLSFLPCHRPYPGGSGGVYGGSIATRVAFDDLRASRHPQIRQIGSRRSRNEAAPVRFMLRPGRLLALHR